MECFLHYYKYKKKKLTRSNTMKYLNLLIMLEHKTKNMSWFCNEVNCI